MILGRDYTTLLVLKYFQIWLKSIRSRGPFRYSVGVMPVTDLNCLDRWAALE